MKRECQGVDRMADQRKFAASSPDDEDELYDLESSGDVADGSCDPFKLEFSARRNVSGRASAPEEAFKDLLRAVNENLSGAENAVERPGNQTEKQRGFVPFESWQTQFAGEAAKLLGFDPATGSAVLDIKSMCGRNFISIVGEITEVGRGLWRGKDGQPFESVRIGAGDFLRNEIGELCRLFRYGEKSIALFESYVKSIGLEDPRLELRRPADGAADKVQPRTARGGVDVVALDASNNYARENLVSGRIPDGFRTAGRNHLFEADGSFSPTDRAATVVDRTKDSKLNEIIAEAKERFAGLPVEERAKALAKYVHDLMCPPGTGLEQEQSYRALMKEHAGKSLLLTEFLGKGSCTQEALLLKVLADELGLKSHLVRGNNGTHAWTTFYFGAGERQIFDSRAGVFGVAESNSEFHKPDASNQSTSETKLGDRVEHNGAHWTVSGFEVETGRLKLRRTLESELSDDVIKNANGGAEPQPGDKITITENGRAKQWTVEGRTSSGAWRMSATEEVKVDRAELATSPLELSGHPNADMRWMQNNWDSIVKDNPQLTAAQRQNLEAARDGLAARSPAPAEQIKAFRELLTEAKRLSTTTDATAARRIKSLTQVAETLANHPDTVHVSAKKLIEAKDVLALETVASKLAEVAPHLDIPTTSGRPTITDGTTYESHASQAMMKALKNGNLAGGGQWVYVPSSTGSAADHLKFDGMLVNLTTGEYLPVDLAMHQPGHPNGAYQTLEKKLSPKEGRLWALTLDRDTMGFGARGGTHDGVLKEAEIIKRIEAYRNGTQASELGLTATQPKPKINTLADLVKTLGKVPSFAPVLSELEAEAKSRSTGDRCSTTAAELAEMGNKLKGSTGLDADSRRIMVKGASDGGTHATEVVYSRDLIESSLRAAVEARKYGAVDTPVNPSSITVDLAGKFMDIACGDVTAGPGGRSKNSSVIRIHSDGRIQVQAKLSSLTFIDVGKIGDVTREVLPRLREMGIDPKPIEQALRRLHTTNLAHLEADLKTVVDAKTAETFWGKYKDLKVLVEAVSNISVNLPLAQEARRVYSLEQEIKQHPTLNALGDADRLSLAQKTAKLNETRPDLTIQDVHEIGELEKTLKVSEAEAVKLRDFRRGLGSEAVAWSPADLQAKQKAAEAAMAGYPGRNAVDVHNLESLRSRLGLPDAKSAEVVFEIAKGLPAVTSDTVLKQVYEVHKTLEKTAKGFNQAEIKPADSIIVAKKFPNLTEEEAREIMRQRKALRSSNFEAIVDATARCIELKNLQPLLEGAAKVWKEYMGGEIPKEPTQDFLDCLKDARKSLDGKLDAVRLKAFDEMIGAYEAEVKAGKAAAAPVATMVHGFITAPSHVGKPGEGLWRPPQGIPPGEQAGLRTQLDAMGRNPLADRANMQEYIGEMSKLIDKWSADLQPDAREVESKTLSVNEARRRLQTLALQEAGNALGAAKLMQNPETGSPAFADAHRAFKEMSDARDAARQKLEVQCKARLAELQKAMNAYAAKHGLPPVELKMASSIPGADALYGLGRGTIVLSQSDLLNKASGTNMLGRGYHELVHFQQDVLVSRTVMDQMKLGNGLSPDAATRSRELAEFKRIYKEKTGIELPDAPADKAAEWHRFVDEVAKKRNGVTLDTTESRRAEAFAKAFKEGKPFTERYSQIAEAVTSLEAERAKLQDRSDIRVAEDLVSRLAAETSEGERLRREFFGDKAEGRLKEVVDGWKNAPKDASGRATIWNEELARRIIQEHIGDANGQTGRIGKLNSEARELHGKFMTLVEKEAHLLAGDVHSAVADKVVDAAYRSGTEGTESRPGTAAPRPAEFALGQRVNFADKPGDVVGRVGADYVLRLPGEVTDVAVAEPINRADLEAKYETVKVTVDGKEEVRYMEKGHPERGMFKVTSVSGNHFIAADVSLVVASAARVTAPATTTTVAPVASVPPPTPPTKPPETLPRPPERPVPERGPAPTADRLVGTSVTPSTDGTLRREEVRVGESMTADRRRDQRELTSEQVRYMEAEAERLKKSTNAEERTKGAELERVVKALKGELGLEAQTTAHRGVIDKAKADLEKRGGGGGGLGVAVGLGILISAALGYYLSQQNVPRSPLHRASISGK